MTTLMLKKELKPVLSLQVKESHKSKNLTTLVQENEQIAEELEHLIARERADESLMIKKSVFEELGLNSEMFQGRDPHYAFYESFQTPSKILVNKEYINGDFEITAENKGKKINISESVELSKDLQLVYESFMGGSGGLSSDIASGIYASTVVKRRQPEPELRLIQLIVNSRYNTDPICRNIVDNLTRYIIGSGMTITVGDPGVQDVVNDFSDIVKLEHIFKDFIKTSFKDGEVGLNIKSRLNKSKDKTKSSVDWDVNKVFSEEVRSFEIHSENPGRKVSYHEQILMVNSFTYQMLDKWVPDIEYYYQFNTRGNLVAFNGVKSQMHDKMSENEVMLWFQHGDKREVRGRAPLEPVLRDLRLYEDFRISRAVLNYERSKVLYIKTNKQINLNRKKTVGDVLNKSSAPKGGVQLNLGPNESYEMMTSSLQAQDADHDGLLFLYAVGSGINIPIYIIGVRADQQNYSAIKNTDSPFNQMIMEYGLDFTLSIKKLIRWVIYRNVEAKVLPPTIKVKRLAREKRQQWVVAMNKGFTLLMETLLKKEADSNKNPKSGTNTKPSAEPNSSAKTVITNFSPDEVSSAIKAIKTEIDQAMEEVDINTVDTPINVTIATAVKPNPLELAKVWFIERKLGMVSSQTLSEERGRNWTQELFRQLDEMILGIYSNGSGTGGSNSANAGIGQSNDAGAGLDAGGSVDSGSGVEGDK